MTKKVASSVTNFIKDLVVVEPTSKEREVFKGETKILKYRFTNSSFHTLDDMHVEASTILKTGENSNIPTKKNYVTKLDYPHKMGGKTTKFCKVTVKVPLDYNETIVKDGQLVEWPFRVLLSIKSLKRIEEI